VEEIQLVYMGLLEAYVYSHREEPASSLGAQLSLLTELRYLYSTVDTHPQPEYLKSKSE
jgi:hypothetical protein